MIPMVAKAFTKSGKFFCFECGNRVDEKSEDCQECGAKFERVTEAFRCPKCSVLLPIGTVICQNCGLKFKVRAVSRSKKMTEDDQFLMKLIDWGKNGKEPQAKGVPREKVKRAKGLKQVATRHAQKVRGSEPPGEEHTPPAPPSDDEAETVGAAELIGRLDEAERGLREVSTRGTRVIELMRTLIEEEADQTTEETRDDMTKLFSQLEAEMNNMYNIEDHITQLRSLLQSIDIPKSSPERETTTETHGLSKQVLKKLLAERDKEVEGLKTREDELEKREELLNRKIRAYAVKKKELSKSEKELETKKKEHEKRSAEAAEKAGMRKGEEPLLDKKDEWMKEQSRIRMGLLEIKNEISSSDGEQVSYIPSQFSGETMEKIEVLEERLADITRERDGLAEKMNDMDASWKDIVHLLKVLDQLLGKLPPAVIADFSRSKDFTVYERVLDKLNI